VSHTSRALTPRPVAALPVSDGRSLLAIHVSKAKLAEAAEGAEGSDPPAKKLTVHVLHAPSLAVADTFELPLDLDQGTLHRHAMVGAVPRPLDPEGDGPVAV
jgi:hypothetical protein